mmetsp:Transcript_71783/g.210304  ORF Transcript_71783/g.210304 Transcript_71783/m.210304 type:complete len:741 (+) Transcript_71783:75-2297(+)
MENEADVSVRDTAGVTPLSRVKEMRWTTAQKDFETVCRQRKSRIEKAQLAQLAARKQFLQQLKTVTAQGPVEEVRDLLKNVERGELNGDTGQLLLRDAARRQPTHGNPLEVCRLLIEEVHLNPSGKDEKGQTALFAAAWVGNVEVCSYLIQQRCEVDDADNNGRTALFAAAHTGQLAVVRTLLQMRADVDRRDAFLHQTALFFAASKSAECVSILLTSRAEASAVDTNGETPLFYASREGVDSAVRMLVHARADVNRMDNQGKPALFHAILHKKAGTAAVLLDECDAWPPEDRSQGAHNLMEMAHSRGLTGIVGQLHAKAHLREALLRAAKEGMVEDVDRAIAQGASMSATNAAGWSALHCAASRQDLEGLECIRRLVEAHGANVDALDRQQQTPLFVAARDGTKECATYLLNNKCDVCLADHNGDTALFDAAQKCRPDVVALLLERGAVAGHRSATKQTAAFRAASAGSVKALARLLDNGAHANDTDIEGRTALFGVQDVECAQLLLDRHCSVDVRDCGMRTALFEAEGFAITRLLLNARAVVNARDQQLQTALFPASARGDIAAVRVLLEAGADGSVVDSAGQTVLFGAAPRVSLEVVKLLVCEAWANPAVKDAKGQTAAQVAKKAKPAAQPNVAEYLARAARAHTPSLGRGAAPQEPAGEKRRRYRFAFTDPTDHTGVAQLQFGTPQYEEALVQLAKQLPWLRMDLWLDGRDQLAVKAEMTGGSPVALQSPLQRIVA